MKLPKKQCAVAWKTKIWAYSYYIDVYSARVAKEGNLTL
jgi:hypothetical protein